MNPRITCNKLLVLLSTFLASIAFVSAAYSQDSVELDFEFFKNEVKVSADTLYGKNAEQYVRDIHNKYFHSGFKNSKSYE